MRGAKGVERSLQRAIKIIRTVQGMMGKERLKKLGLLSLVKRRLRVL